MAGWVMIALVIVGFAMAPLLFPKSGTEIMDAPVEQATGIDLIPKASGPRGRAARTGR